MIHPTIGRVLWYYQHGKVQIDAGEQAHASLVAYVHGDRCVNLAIFDANGVPYCRTSVTLLQDTDVPGQAPCAAWMPYQVGQAAKAITT